VARLMRRPTWTQIAISLLVEGIILTELGVGIWAVPSILGPNCEHHLNWTIGPIVYHQSCLTFGPMLVSLGLILVLGGLLMALSSWHKIKKSVQSASNKPRNTRNH
jgi:predicted phage tail protein